MAKKYKLLLVQRYDDDFSFLKVVNGNYFNEYTVDGNKYLVSKRIYSVKGEEEESMKVIFRTLELDSVYVLIDDSYIYLGTYEDDMNELLQDPINANNYNNKLAKIAQQLLEKTNSLRKYKR